MDNSREGYKFEKMSSWWIKLLAIIFGLFEIISIVLGVVYIIVNKEIFQKILEMENGKMIVLIAVICLIIHVLIAFMFIFTIYRVGELTDERNVLREEIENIDYDIDKIETKVIKHRYN
ncbi:MAG: hypothetical protein J6W35_00435 [Eubacterium sp.]|nr:hypothetical protein [Eubacterium sp.]